jgi:hypothetical protein
VTLTAAGALKATWVHPSHRNSSETADRRHTQWPPNSFFLVPLLFFVGTLAHNILCEANKNKNMAVGDLVN